MGIKKYNKKIQILIVFFSLSNIYLLFTILRTGIGYWSSQNQSFSHKIHSGKFSISCLFCHFQAETSSYANIPSTKICVQCHIALKNESPLLVNIIQSYDSSISLKWKKIYNLPDYVHFDHRAHLFAGIDCSTCHGNVEEMDSLFVTRKLTMGWCVDCHQRPFKFYKKLRKISGSTYIANFLQADSIDFNFIKLQQAKLMCSICHF